MSRLEPQVAIAAGVAPEGVAAADFNGDGVTDLAVTDDSNNTVLTLLGDQSATFSTSGIWISGSGTHNVLASYSGDASRTASQSATVPLSATMITPTVSVSCSPNPVTYSAGSSPISACVATLSGGTGTITFNGNWTTPVIGGGATLTGFSQLAAGTYPISATYNGDSNFNTATASTTLSIVDAVTSVLTWSAGNQFESTASLSLAPVTAGNANGVRPRCSVRIARLAHWHLRMERRTMELCHFSR